MPAIVMALSNVPGTLHQDQLKGLKDKFSAGHPYTALLFLGTPGKQEIFRAVMKKLCSTNGLATEYAEIEKLQEKDTENQLTPKIMEFWKDHGEMLNKKLNVTQDGELLHLAKTDSNCASYLEACKAGITELSIHDADELGNGAYEGEGSFLGLNPEHYLHFLEMNTNHATLEMNKERTKRLWPNFENSINAIKNMSSGGTEEETRTLQKELYTKYHKALMTYLNGIISKKVYDEELQDQDYMRELYTKYGMRLPKVNGKAHLESVEYAQEVAEDFEKFLV